MPALKPFVRTNRHSVGAQPGNVSTPHGRSSLATNVVTADSPEHESDNDDRSTNVNGLKSTARNSGSSQSQSRGSGLSTSQSMVNLRSPAFASSSTGSNVSTPVSRMRNRARDSYSGSPSMDAPGTPYSAHYSPSTPSQLSRSTIVPFDRESSRHDAEEAIRNSATKGSQTVKQTPEREEKENPPSWRRGLLNFTRFSSSESVSQVNRSEKRKAIVRKPKLMER